MLLERLNALLRDSDSLLSRERDGHRRMYLYDMGDWWVSFERSACRLCGLFPGCDTTVLRLYDRPYPLVMASVSDRSLRAYGVGERPLVARLRPSPPAPTRVDRLPVVALRGIVLRPLRLVAEADTIRWGGTGRIKGVIASCLT